MSNSYLPKTGIATLKEEGYTNGANFHTTKILSGVDENGIERGYFTGYKDGRVVGNNDVHRALIKMSASQQLTDGVWTKVNLDTTGYLKGFTHDTANKRLVATEASPLAYDLMLGANLSVYDNNGANVYGYGEIAISINGIRYDIARTDVVAATDDTAGLTTFTENILLSAGNFIEMYVRFYSNNNAQSVWVEFNSQQPNRKGTFLGIYRRSE